MSLKEKIQQFKKKSYWSKGLTGLLFTLLISVSLFLILTGLEYSFWFESTTRTFLFYLLLFVFSFLLVFKVIGPFMAYLGVLRQQGDKEAASDISSKIPELEDKLINYLELENSESPLAKASASKKGSDLININFDEAIDTTSRRRYGKYEPFVRRFEDF